ncbi:MAG: hypothetical protein BWY63_00912 [Chloroflexi bacterium ADurb.Bin360]|nr:MAG: hypothetical protein BWY63_00912 [Chloroflexi bacterium ADurb.Bin360]
MVDTEFLLSVEELALAFSALGQPQMAHDIMVAQLGNMPADEAHVRLKTAGHSLLARGWLTLDAEARLHLAPDLERAASALVQPVFSLRYHRSQPQGQWSAAFHFLNGAIIAHRVEQGVLHHLVELHDPAAAIQQGVEFFDLARVPAFEAPLNRLSGDILTALKDLDAAALQEQLQAQPSLSNVARQWLSEDLLNSRFRGSALRVVYTADHAPTSERGLLLLGGPQRSWLFRFNGPDAGAPVDVLPGTASQFAQEIRDLLS